MPSRKLVKKVCVICRLPAAMGLHTGCRERQKRRQDKGKNVFVPR